MQSDRKPRILVSGIAGASLGTEIAKSLHHAGGYDILGCDISPLAFGHYDQNFGSTYVVGRSPTLRICWNFAPASTSTALSRGAMNRRC